jgi:hypothetical protein
MLSPHAAVSALLVHTLKQLIQETWPPSSQALALVMSWLQVRRSCGADSPFSSMANAGCMARL